jgi:ankyrin repeat protein
MHAAVKHLVGLWMFPLLSLATLAAAPPDARVADAVEQRDRAAVATLIKAGADVKAPQPDGATALHWAAHWDDIETADRLLRAGAKVDAANDHGVTPLALACENGNGAMVDRLLQAGANPNAAVATGETALMTAARTGSVAAVRALLARGANVNAKEASHGQTALMWAAAYGHSDAVKVLIEGGADINLRSEVRTRTVHTGNRFGDRGNDKGVVRMDLGGFTPLLFTARQGAIEPARALLAAGANVNETAPTGASALAIAALSGHSAFSLFLLDKGADPNAAGAGYTALHSAVLHGDHDLVKALLARGANPNAKLTKGTPSRYYSKDSAFNEALIGANPFWLASRYGDVEMMRRLVAAGGDPRLTLPDGTTTLMADIAATSGPGVATRRDRYLSPADAAAKAPGEDEKITLEAAKLVLELGVDVNAATQTGDTALHMAAVQGLNTVVELLVARGANLEAKNKRGQTVLAATAAIRGRQFTGEEVSRKSTVDLLRKLGAKE